MQHSLTRVELHGATWQDYENLHSAMAVKSFTRTIIGADGITYRLPPAMYYLACHDAATSDMVRKDAVQAINTVWKKTFEVISTMGESAWRGLSRA